MKPVRLEHDRGIALVAALVLLVSLTAFGLIAVEMAASELQQTARLARASGTLYQAEAGAEEARMRFDPADSNYFGAGLMETGPTYGTSWRVCVGSPTDPDAIALGCTVANTVPSVQTAVPFNASVVRHQTQNGVIQCYAPDQVPATYDAVGGACLSGHLPVEHITAVASSGEGTHTVMITLVPRYKTPFSLGIKGRQTISLSTDACTDSYDSGSGSYPGNPVFCTGAGSQGHIGTDSDADAAVSLAGIAAVNGSVSLPPTGQEDDIITGTGSHNGVVREEVPTYQIPSIPAGLSCSGPLVITNSGNSVTLGTSGSSTAFCFSQISVSGSGELVTQGNVTLYVTGQVTVNSEIRNISTDPTNLTIIVTGTDTVTFGTDRDFYGAIYAPQSDFAATDDSDFYGAIVANQATLSGGADIHFDTALLSKMINVTEGFRQFTWSVL